MTEVRKPRITERLWVKVMAILMMCALLAGIVIEGRHIIIMDEYDILTDSEYWYESDRCDRMMRIEAVSIMQAVINEPDRLEEYRNKNISFTVKDNRTGEVLYEIINSEDCIYRSTWAADVSADGSVIVRKASDFSDGKYLVSVNLARELKPVDDYYSSYETVQTYLQNRNQIFGKTIGMLLMMLIILIWLVAAAGHDVHHEGIHLYLLERIPADILTAALAVYEFFIYVIIQSGNGDYDIYNPLFIYEAAPIAIAIIIGIVLWLLAICAQFKAKTLFSGSYLGKLVKAAAFIIIGLPLIWKLVLALFAYGVVVFFCLDQHFMFGAVMITVLAITAVLWWAIHFRRVTKYAEKIADGQFEEISTKMMPGDLKKHVSTLNSISDGLSKAVEQQMKSERLKTELITNVSHDIRTPLTSIINYVDLLKKEHTDEQEKEYLEVLSRQSARLKKLTEDIIEASKAASGNININAEKISVKEILYQSLAEYDEKLKDRKLEIVVGDLSDDLCVMADGTLLWRILSNLYSNIVKYAMADTRVYISAEKSKDNTVITMKNISSAPLNISAEDLMERFVRGDESRHEEGSGLGLNIAASLAELMGGKLVLSIDGDLFKAELMLPSAQ